MKILLQILYVGVSMQTFYFYDFGLPLISIVSLLLMSSILLTLSLENGLYIIIDTSAGVSLGYVLILFWSIVGLLFYGEIPDLKRFTAFSVVIVGAITAGSLIRHIPLENLVRYFLMFHTAFFFLQFLTYYATGYGIDYLAPITGEEQRLYGGTFTFPIINRFMRATGLYQEPGTYATFVAPFVALFERWYGLSYANKRLFWISLSTLFLSFSAYGILFGAIIFLCAKNARRIHRIFGFIVGLTIVAPLLYYRFVLRPSLGLDTGIGPRQEFIDQSFDFLLTNPIGLFFGSDLLVLDPRADFVLSNNDIGLLFYFLHFAGPVLAIIFVAILLYYSLRLDRASRVALVIVLLSKHSPFAPFFPFIMVAILWSTGKLNSNVTAIKQWVHSEK